VARVAVLVLFGMLVLALAGCSSGSGGSSTAAKSPVTVVKTVSGKLVGLQIVAASKLAAADKQAISDWIANGSPHDASPALKAGSYTPFVQDHVQLASIDTTSDNGIMKPIAVFQLDPAGTGSLDAYTTAHPSETIIVVLDGKVLTAETLPAPITDGRIQLSGDSVWIESLGKTIMPTLQ
jgi:preprotein translocase subunit SecD